MLRKAFGWALAPAIAIGALAISTAEFGSGPAAAAGIAWEKQGSFQTCLDAKAKAWIEAKVELVVNEDPAMSAMDDKSVAVWAAEAIQDCAAKAPGDSASETQFMRYMARWRDHIYEAADDLRRRNRPD